MEFMAELAIAKTGIAAGVISKEKVTQDLLKMASNNKYINFRDQLYFTLAEIELCYKDLIIAKTKDGCRLTISRFEWSDYEYQYDRKSKQINFVETGKINQIACKLAHSISIHKSQGLQFDDTLIDFGDYVFADAMVYVALSRCKTLNGLGLTRPIKHKDIKINKEVLEFFDKA
jgi:hypothetical protein